MTAFGFPALGLTGAISSSAIAVNAPSGTDVTGLAAEFTVSAGASVSVEGVVQTSGVTVNNFSSPVAYTVTAEDGSTAGYTVTVNVAPPALDATIAPATASFDKNPFLQANVEVAVTLQGNTLVNIANGTDSLVQGTDYTISDNRVTIKKDYLAALPVGTATLTFDMNAGSDPVLTVTVTESTAHVASVSISGPETVIVPTPGGPVAIAQFQATVKDQFNQTVSGESVSWALQSPATGVSLDAVTGLLTLDSSATAGSSIVVQATLNSDAQLKGEYPVYLANSGTPYWPVGSKLTAIQIGDDDVVLTWPAAQDDQALAKYELYQVSGATQTVVNATYSYSVTASVYSSQIAGLVPGSTYTFNVKAFDNEGNYTGAGLGVTVKTSADVLPPVWPAGKSLVVKTMLESGATLEWSAAVDDRGVDRYVIVRNGTDIATAGATAREYTLDRLTPGTEYQIAIEAIDLKGNRSVDGPTLALTVPDNSGVTVSTSYTVGTDTNATALAANKMLSADAPDGAMKNASYLSMVLSAGETRTLHAGFKLPSDIAGHQVKTFVWEGTDPLNSNANPITGASVIPQ
jgi:hypothetical protein